MILSTFPLETIVDLHVYRWVFQKVVNLVTCRVTHTDASI